jgi:hypothetical protein
VKPDWKPPAQLAYLRRERVAGRELWVYGRPASQERWRPTRWIPAREDPRPRQGPGHQVCSQCWRTIPAGRPGSSKGDRGTRAWFCIATHLYTCLDCWSADECTAESVMEG